MGGFRVGGQSSAMKKKSFDRHEKIRCRSNFISSAESDGEFSPFSSIANS